MKTGMVIVKLLFLGALFIVSNYDLYLSDGNDREVFSELYYGWLSNLFSQGIELSSYVVKFEWLPEVNETYIR